MSDTADGSTGPTTGPPQPPVIDPATRRSLAAGLYNRTWALLEKPDRTTGETDEMIHAAHASRFHWGEVADAVPANLARGEWLCSRVYAVLDRAEPALWHARRCLATIEAEGGEDWDLAAAYEAMARAYLAAGDRAQTVLWNARGRAALDDISDPEDRDQIAEQLDTIL